ncbi:MAG: phosphoribosylformylglycinamidine synthase, partial [Acutalibacteraceae bacterium]
MVYRVYVEKKAGLDNEARELRHEIRHLLMIKSVEKVRVFNRYDVEKIDKALFEQSIKTVFSEPQLDDVSYELCDTSDCKVFATEYLPGQFDQRADSAAQCIQIISRSERPIVKSAKVYLIYGDVTEDELCAIKHHLINPVESREASLDTYETLSQNYEIPTTVKTLDGFIGFDDEQLEQFRAAQGLAMDFDDIKFCQQYFISERRDPTITEIKMIDTYWSDHCRHTTFLTTIDSVKFEDELLQSAYNDYLATRKSL